VAFSGEVNDSQSGPDAFTETSKALNPGLNGRDIRDAFKGEDFQILLVANKFQTGFDQPLLCGMYVDRRLAGIQAVQTLSRLNRAYPSKDTTYVLDFVNSSEEVLAAFKTYYETAELEAVTDPTLTIDWTESMIPMRLRTKWKRKCVAGIFPVIITMSTCFMRTPFKTPRRRPTR
jgi:type I restriction enzyme, R subunit